jgi:hypothetical protein
VALDCCHAAGIVGLKGIASAQVKDGLSPAIYQRLASGQGRAVLASADREEKSYILPGVRNSLFTQHLLAGLRGGVASEDGLIRLFATTVTPSGIIDRPPACKALVSGWQDRVD